MSQRGQKKKTSGYDDPMRKPVNYDSIMKKGPLKFPAYKDPTKHSQKDEMKREPMKFPTVTGDDIMKKPADKTVMSKYRDYTLPDIDYVTGKPRQKPLPRPQKEEKVRPQPEKVQPKPRQKRAPARQESLLTFGKPAASVQRTLKLQEILRF